MDRDTAVDLCEQIEQFFTNLSDFMEEESFDRGLKAGLLVMKNYAVHAIKIKAGLITYNFDLHELEDVDD